MIAVWARSFAASAGLALLATGIACGPGAVEESNEGSVAPALTGAGAGDDSVAGQGNGRPLSVAGGRGVSPRAGSGGVRGGTPRPVGPDDTYTLSYLSELELSPDGKSALYVVDWADRENDYFMRALTMLPLGEGEPRAIGGDDVDARDPKFSPDGHRFAYLGDPGEGPQIWATSPGSRKAKQITDVAEGVDEYDWSPDGKQFVFARLDPDPSNGVSAQGRSMGGDEDRPAAERERHDNDAEDPIVITRTQIQRDGEGYLDNRRSHLWMVSSQGGEPRQITVGPYDDGEPRWSPDGRWIAFSSNRTTDPDSNDNSDIFVIHPDGTGLTCVTASPGPDDAPSWSHKSDRIAFAGALRANDYYQLTYLMVVSVTGTETVANGGAAPAAPLNLTRDLDTWVASDAYVVGDDSHARANWSPDDRSITIALERRGANFVAAIPSDGSGKAREILGGPKVYDRVRLSHAGDRLFFTVSDATHPPELHSSALDGSGIAKLTSIDDEVMAGLKLSTPRKFVAKNRAGDTVESWLYPPVDLDSSGTGSGTAPNAGSNIGKKYPLIVYIHGGPQAYDGDYFDLGLENQMLPGAGYAVLRVNYRGSTSYGERFCSAIRGDWHEREFEDLMASVDSALAANPWLDPDRLGIGGWSYGGIMTIWTVSHTNRFKVGVPERFEVDYLSSFGEDQWQTQYLTEFGSPFEHEDLYRKLSPGTYIRNIKTPLYLISDELDGNCPLPQAMQFYQRLKLLGMPTELVIYPGEAHSMSSPKHLKDRLERLLGWYGRHLKQDR